jgi:ribosomal protein S4
MVRGGAPAPRSGDGWPPAKKSGRKTKRATVISRVGEKYTKRVYMPRKKETLTEYQSQYKAKQQIKYYYGGISETSLRRLVAKRTIPGGHPAICQLEKRLDVVLFRLGFASSILEARSLIKGGVVKLDQVAQNSSVGVVREAKRVGLLSNTQVQVGSRITIDTTKAG